MTSTDRDLCASLHSLSSHRLKRLGAYQKNDSQTASIFRPGRNVWRKANATRVAFLIDADPFFRAFVESAKLARNQIFILGWDTDSRTELPCNDLPNGNKTIALGELLLSLVESEPSLEIRVLTWDFDFIYFFEREFFPGVRFSLNGHPRLRFVLDRQHPLWASHHQKLVVIDDRVAFSGGLDLTQRRWDTAEHQSHDDRRVDPGGHSYGPFHDVQICVEGEAASALGDIARLRWEAATGEQLLPLSEQSVPGHREQCDHSLWPPSAEVSICDVSCGIARTIPSNSFSNVPGAEAHTGEILGVGKIQPTREIERLFLDSIRSASKYIYIENQYFTSVTIAKALARRLREATGPEVILVLPRDQTGWLEESTMGVLRARALRVLEKADLYGRLRCFYPVVPGLSVSCDDYVKVHSKVMLIDDSFVRIGSANMNNRSMGLDTECDLAIEAVGRDDVRRAIGVLRSRLLGEHLDVDPGEFDSRFIIYGSLVKTVDSFRSGERTLIEITSAQSSVRRRLIPSEWIDPRGPHSIRRWMSKHFVHNRRRIISLIFVCISIYIFSDLSGHRLIDWIQYLSQVDSPAKWAQRSWHWVRSWDAESIAILIESFRSHDWAVPAVLLGFALGVVIFIPFTAMMLAVSLSYPPVEAWVLSLAGAMIAAIVTYGLGRYWAWSKSRTLSRPWIRNLSEEIGKGGVWAITLVRLTPVAPFAAVGLVAGGLRLRLLDYLLGTFLGLLPGSFALIWVSSGAVRWIVAGKGEWVAAGLSFVIVCFSLIKLRRRFQGRGRERRAW
jgi:phospholipase D1/2